MIDNIVGSIFFEFVGALVKWITYAALQKIKGGNVIRFKEIWKGRKTYQNSEIILNGFSNIILGLLVVVGLFVLIIKLT